MKITFIKYPQSYIQAAAIGTPEFDNMMKKYYPNVKDVTKYIQLDPTYREGSNQMGTYGRWILNLANRGPIVNEGHLTDVLTRFEDEKKHLINKDIMKFKSVDDVENMLNDEDSYADRSHRQEVRDRQKARRGVDLNKDAEKVYQDSEWEVWIPHTYAASCKLGEGTKWCTASTESDYYYDKYKDEYGGDYYIIISKSSPRDKLQFHFESDQFMNKDDDAVDLNGFLNENRGLRDFFMKMYPQYVLDLDDPDSVVYEYSGGYVPEAVRNYIKHVIVSGVDEIDAHAFQGCASLSTVEILDTVTTIGESAFSDCTSLTNITLPDTLTHIEAGAFAYCHMLPGLNFPESLQYLGHHVFLDCDSLVRISIPGAVRTIPYAAFIGCSSLKYVHIDDGVQVIENVAFQECEDLRCIDIPDSVTEIGGSVFKYCRDVVIYTDNPIAIEYADEYDRRVVTSTDSNLATL